MHRGLKSGAVLYKQEEEQAALDDEAERRRKRVQAWQEQKAKQMADEEAAAKAAEDEAVQWTFEDDSDEVRWVYLPIPLLVTLPQHRVIPCFLCSLAARGCTYKWRSDAAFGSWKTWNHHVGNMQAGRNLAEAFKLSLLLNQSTCSGST